LFASRRGVGKGGVEGPVMFLRQAGDGDDGAVRQQRLALARPRRGWSIGPGVLRAFLRKAVFLFAIMVRSHWREGFSKQTKSDFAADPYPTPSQCESSIPEGVAIATQLMLSAIACLTKTRHSLMLTSKSLTWLGVADAAEMNRI
jgi:hypothetical protein